MIIDKKNKEMELKAVLMIETNDKLSESLSVN